MDDDDDDDNYDDDDDVESSPWVSSERNHLSSILGKDFKWNDQLL